MTDSRADLAERMVPVACRLAAAVRDDPDDLAHTLGALTPEETPALLVVLAAMVDIERPAAELLAWVDWDQPPVPIPVGSRYGIPADLLAAHARHSRGHRDPTTIAGERNYQAARYQARKARAAGAA